MAYNSSSRTDDNPDDSLPSYEDVLREDRNAGKFETNNNNNNNNNNSGNNSTNSSINTTQRSNNSSHNQHHHTSSNRSYTTRSRTRIPWTYPNSYYCSKCENTGFKKRNGEKCSKCWQRFGPLLPPKGDSNKHKKGHLLSSKAPPKKLYMPPDSEDYSNNTYQQSIERPFRTQATPNMVMNRPKVIRTGGNYGFQQAQPQGLVVQPGDPRIGGRLCAECRGTGRISFFLDFKLCPVCGGVGRVF
ncbi:uncharacterized protein SCDLUD_004861 [Saccharomycodes ludwigii]|uniref:uncharacterized protein n=1 Tax=Saccharomycodes ludwigii TaxID=36035 RepID=UPI001E81E1B6|nr:hypothetical protein SCDLUD_004861 [Saccharomycodes ludwigii]KAH3899418.1 hypothetical protein SCDLUD_004861 [Saccharomycodes ludwigii]